MGAKGRKIKNLQFSKSRDWQDKLLWGIIGCLREQKLVVSVNNFRNISMQL